MKLKLIVNPDGTARLIKGGDEDGKEVETGVRSTDDTGGDPGEQGLSK